MNMVMFGILRQKKIQYIQVFNNVYKLSLFINNIKNSRLKK